MAKPRTELQTIFEELLGSRNVYYQPPESLKLKYPCIVYDLNPIKAINADNAKYLTYRQYLVTLIDPDPDSEFVDKILYSDKLYFSSFDRAYPSNDLNHFVFRIYF